MLRPRYGASWVSPVPCLFSSSSLSVSPICLYTPRGAIHCFVVLASSFLSCSQVVPSEYLLSLLGTRPQSARYLSATCSVLNRTNTAQLLCLYRTRMLANRCLLLGESLAVCCQQSNMLVANIRKNSHISVIREKLLWIVSDYLSMRTTRKPTLA